MILTPEQVKEIAARADALVTVDWEYARWGANVEGRGSADLYGYHPGPLRGHGPLVLGTLTTSSVSSDTDDIHGEFIAHARQDVPNLIETLHAAEAERDQLRAIFACDLLEDSEAMRLAYERGKSDRSAASHLETIREAFDRCGVEYVVRERGEWTYLFCCNSLTRLEFEQADLDDLCRTAQFSEFRGGAISSI